MQLRKTVAANAFFIKLFLVICALLFAGIGMSTYFLSADMTERLFATEVRYEQEVLSKVQVDLTAKQKSLNDIINQMYFEDKVGSETVPCLVDLISPYRSSGDSDQHVMLTLRQFMRNVINSNPFITDVMIFDYANARAYFDSSEILRFLAVNHDIFGSAFMDSIQSGPMRLSLITNYVPDYLSERAGNESVITLFINLYDTDHLTLDKAVGAIAFNLRPQALCGALAARDGMERILVVDQHRLVLFDTDGVFTGQPFESASLQGQRYEIVRRPVDLGDLTLLGIERAKQLLLHSDARVYEIASAVGFPDTHYFLKTFKRQTGQSPSELCKSLQ